MFLNDTECYAHANQSLPDHMLGVGSFAKDAAEPFDAMPVAELSGTLHDAGKNTKQFQDHLQGKKTPPNYHTHQGAILAKEICKKHSNIPPYVVDTIVGVIACHHGGLTSVNDWNERLRTTKSKPIPQLDHEFRQSMEELASKISGIDDRLRNHPTPLLLLALWVRMVYSCVVDGDFIDTESVMNEENARLRERQTPTSLDELLRLLDAHVGKLEASANDPAKTMQARRLFKEALLDHVRIDRAVWSVSGPCGVGKSLTSLSWGLRHARHHGLTRIIYVLPYNTISDQMLQSFTEIFGSLSKTCVVETTSSFEFDKDDDDDMTMRLSSENFDAEIVITSSVNFFESLFSNKPSKCRKLHNIVNSVVIIDEAQRMPAEWLRPTLATLETLVSDFGCSVLMMSGTMPSFKEDDWIRPDDHPTIEDDRLETVRKLLSGRVRYEDRGPMTIDNVCSEITRQMSDGTSSMLVVFNKTIQAHVTAKRFIERNDSPDISVFCLSNRMKRKQRKQLIEQIRELLKEGKRVVVFSTSLIEAGIDLDFSMAMRAWAGLDSILQIGGRVNRNGTNAPGLVIVFDMIAGPGDDTCLADKTWMQQERNTAKNAVGDDITRLDEDKVSTYLEGMFYGHAAWKGHLGPLTATRHRQKLITQLNQSRAKLPQVIDFKEIAHEYKIIKTGTECLLIPNDEEAKACYWKLKHGYRCKTDEHSIGIWSQERERMVARGIVEELCDGVWSIKPELVQKVYGEFGLEFDITRDDDIWSADEIVL